MVVATVISPRVSSLLTYEKMCKEASTLPLTQARAQTQTQPQPQTQTQTQKAAYAQRGTAHTHGIHSSRSSLSFLFAFFDISAEFSLAMPTTLPNVTRNCDNLFIHTDIFGEIPVLGIKR